jgi:hypothetical protein
MRTHRLATWWLAASALVGQAKAPAPETPATPAAAPKASAWPIAPPTKPWFDAKRLADRVAAMRPLVEKHTGLTFRRDPIVLVASDESWAKLIAEEVPNARDPSSPWRSRSRCTSPERDSLVIGPYIGYHLLANTEGAGARDARAAQASLAHELVHVLQQQHFELPSRMKAARAGDEKLVLKSMVEGFATWVEWRVAADGLALDSYVKHNERMHRRNGRMEYVRGRDFFARLHERGGIPAMHDAMRNEPLPLHEFARIAVAKPAAKAAAPAEAPGN